MKSFEDISVSVLICLVIVVLYITYMTYVEGRHLHPKIQKKPATMHELLHSCKTGIARGCIMGLVTGGVPGAAVYGTVLGVVNVIITGTEHIV
jgi:hypothetical protein